MLKSFLCDGGDYDEYIKRIESSYPTITRCCTQFSKGSVIYRCEDCNTGDLSCMCAYCFKHGNHEVGMRCVRDLQGHKYRRELAGAWGCCDCGDSGSIREEGWCEKHRNAKQMDNPDTLMQGEYVIHLSNSA